MSRRANRKLNPNAVKAANAAVGNRKLHPTDPADAADRKKWMDAYEAAGGNSQDTAQGNEPVGEPCQTCPKPVIDLEYVRADGTGVAGAKYVVYSVDIQGNKDGVYETEGTLDGDGRAHITDVPEITQFDYYFEDDPQPYEPTKTPAARIDKQEATSDLSKTIDWIWGTVQGDFNKDQSISQIGVNAGLGLIPILDQVLDVRDLIAGLLDLFDYYLAEEEEQKKHDDVLGVSYETWLWINVFLICIGCIPTFGSAVKGILKGLLSYLIRMGKQAGGLSSSQLVKLWELLISIANYFGKGNAHRWLKDDFPKQLNGWIDDAGSIVDDALKSILKLIDEAKAYAKKFGIDSMAATAEKWLDLVSKLKSRMHSLKPEITNWLQKQINDVVEAVQKKIGRGSTGTEGNQVVNRRVQTQAQPPDPDIPRGKHLRNTPKAGGKYSDETFPMSEKYIQKDKDYGVKYYDNAELEDFRVVSDESGNLVYAKSGKPVNTDKGIYVMDAHGNIYVHECPAFGEVHHSSLSQGQNIAGAGQIQVTNGKVVHLDEGTGHYGANQKSGTANKVAGELTDQGVDVSATPVKPYEK